VSLLTHSIPVEIQRLQCIISKQALANNTFWRLACVVDWGGRAFVLWAVPFQKYDSGSSQCEQHQEYNVASC
jgi:hypothetical protein